MKKFLQRSFMWCSVFTPYSDKSPGDHNTPELRGAGSQLKEEMALQTVNLPTNHSFVSNVFEINRLFLQPDYWGKDRKCDLFIQRIQTTDNYTSLLLVSVLSTGINNSSVLEQIT